LLVRGSSRPAGEVSLELRMLPYMPPGKRLRVQLTENRCNIVSVWRGRETYRVHVHRMFTVAEPRLVRALARYVLHNDARAATLIGEFIDSHKHMIHKAPRRPQRLVLRTQGRVHDLLDVFERLNRRYFDGKHDARITWGPARRRPAQRSIKVGSFSVEDRLIRIHPALDQEMVPGYFLEWIVFHEMLHGKHSIRRVGGRRCFHPPELAREERQFPDYGRARQWERNNLGLLLS
jgi:hypothetical protein